MSDPTPPLDNQSSQITIAKITTVGAVVAAIVGAAASITTVLIQKPATQASVSSLFDRWFPIGSVVSSVLPPRDFSSAAGDSGTFEAGKSKWIPADGRQVSGSEYTKRLGHANVPDFRGLFLRGLNTFDPSIQQRPSEQRDPQPDRFPGDYQGDSVKKHSHAHDDSYIGGNAKDGAGGGGYDRKVEKKQTSEAPADSLETRPKNSAVYYYIKIN